ncbi:LysR family transcriptional regulator ArgP [Roseicyclus persicicus]|uniref:LysR family transcriptional regulator ArgP n=1 Tax=Roseicyclus persicicus TaxID=2650661 RepID=A0A7X6GXJ7_9RHOB|nr:LysR family transcriptional regulator ArgP [Roseibacterium persicicum]NKX43489.1 LysR family transcriptional regulator ArgP [Roseibacterium persicicum]
MIDRAALAAFAAVLQTGSFEGAAGQLGVTQSAVSQRIKALEEALGTALVRRSRPATPTGAGRRLMAHAEAVGLLERDLRRDLALARPDPGTPVRIAVTADSLATWVIPALAAVEGLLYDLVIDDQDHSAELLRAGEVAAAITASDRPVPGCDVRPLGAIRYLAFASPGFVARHFPDGVTAPALARAPALTFNRKDRLQRAWAEAATGERVFPVTHYLGSTHGITDAALAGLGWAVNPEPLVAPLVAEGRLVDLDPAVRIDTALYWQVPRQGAAALADLTRALRRAGADQGR